MSYPKNSLKMSSFWFWCFLKPLICQVFFRTLGKPKQNPWPLPQRECNTTFAEPLYKMNVTFLLRELRKWFEESELKKTLLKGRKASIMDGPGGQKSILHQNRKNLQSIFFVLFTSMCSSYHFIASHFDTISFGHSLCVKG